MNQISIALTIAGFDPSGGAGLQADLKTFQTQGVYGLSTATAITVQNTQGVKAVYPLVPRQVREQLSNLKDDFNIGSIKIGMLGSADNARVVAGFLRTSKVKQVVLDPVINSQSGLMLSDDDCLQVIQKQIIPQTCLITPNTEEAAQICGFEVNDKESMREAAAYLHGLGTDYVLIKGGHLTGDDIYDLFFDGVDYTFHDKSKIAGPSPHGTGCILSSAIAANLARDEKMAQAISNAQDCLCNLRQNPLVLGKGYPLLSH